MEEQDIILEKINLGEDEESSRNKIYNNDARLRTNIVSAHQKADDNTKSIDELDKKIGKSKTERREYVNVSLLTDTYSFADRTAARTAVPTDIRALGQRITYCIAGEGWKTEQYIGTLLSQWTNALCWREEIAGVIYSLGRADSAYADTQILDCGGAGDNPDRIIDCGGAANQIV